MKERSSVLILDVRDDLRRAKHVERVYDLTDSHWNPRGAFFAYERIMQAISRWVSGGAGAAAIGVPGRS